MVLTQLKPRLLSVLLLMGAGSAEPAIAARESVGLPPATNLKADGIKATQTRRPIVILFSLPDCHFCNEVRQNYLIPLLRNGIPEKRPLLREVVITGMHEIIAFNGEGSTETAVAKSYAVRVAPTVLIIDANGMLLVPPVVGGDTSGLYGGYLENALNDANGRLLQQ
ncbi:MAG: hypothetical protein NVSMB6_26810 [Burkholderiaceae bacterium]